MPICLTFPIPIRLKFSRNFTKNASDIKKKYDAIVIGGGHNGLTAVEISFFN